MLMDIKCAVINSIEVALTFDDGSKKTNVVAIGDLIDVEYNANGMRKHAEGKVAKISAPGTDPKAWYIIVDCSDDFDSERAKFSPMSILDLTIIRKAYTVDVVSTPLGDKALPYLRIVAGRLQWSKDGFNWRPVQISARDVVEDIDPASGNLGPHGVVHGDRPHDPHPSVDEDVLEDANY